MKNKIKKGFTDAFYYCCRWICLFYVVVSTVEIYDGFLNGAFGHIPATTTEILIISVACVFFLFTVFVDFLYSLFSRKRKEDVDNEPE